MIKVTVADTSPNCRGIIFIFKYFTHSSLLYQTKKNIEHSTHMCLEKQR